MSPYTAKGNRQDVNIDGLSVAYMVNCLKEKEENKNKEQCDTTANGQQEIY
jgi:hypothetical protein